MNVSDDIDDTSGQKTAAIASPGCCGQRKGQQHEPPASPACRWKKPAAGIRTGRCLKCAAGGGLGSTTRQATSARRRFHPASLAPPGRSCMGAPTVARHQRGCSCSITDPLQTMKPWPQPRLRRPPSHRTATKSVRILIERPSLRFWTSVSARRVAVMTAELTDGMGSPPAVFCACGDPHLRAAYDAGMKAGNTTASLSAKCPVRGDEGLARRFARLSGVGIARLSVPSWLRLVLPARCSIAKLRA